MGLRENLEAWAEKRRMEAAAAEYNHHHGSSGQVAFISASAETFGAKRESHPGFSLVVSYNTLQVINIQRHMKG